MFSFKKLAALATGVCMMGALFAGCGGDSASTEKKDDKAAVADSKPLTGGGSKIIYIITPSHSNPFFKTEADAASAKAKAMGY